MIKKLFFLTLAVIFGTALISYGMGGPGGSANSASDRNPQRSYFHSTEKALYKVNDYEAREHEAERSRLAEQAREAARREQERN